MKSKRISKFLTTLTMMTASVIMVFSASACNKHVHDFSKEEVTKQATCTTEGEKTLTCECGETKTETIAKTDHNFSKEVVTKQATCVEEGEKTLTCECGETKTETIAKTSHTYSNHICKICGTVEAGQTPTSYDWVDDTAYTQGAKRVIYAANNTERNATGTKQDPISFDYLMRGLTDFIVSAGDTIVVYPETYHLSERIRLGKENSGTYNNFVKVVNANPTKKVVLDFTAMEFNSNNRGVQVDGDYQYWYGIDIMGAGDNGMYIGGSYNIVENCEFYYNRDSGLQLGRSYGVDLSDENTYKWGDIEFWPNYNLVKNCTSWGNYDNETFGENADGFAAKLTVGYGNVFDGCIAYRNSDDGWDLYAKTDSGNIGQITMYNCVAFENGFLPQTRDELNKMYPTFQLKMAENPKKYTDVTADLYSTKDGDGNGFKLGGSSMVGDVLLYNCMSYYNKMHGVTDNSNPGVLSLNYVTSFDNSATLDENGAVNGTIAGCSNFNTARTDASYNNYSNCISVSSTNKIDADDYLGAAQYTIFYKNSSVSYSIDQTIDAVSSYNEEGKDYTTKVGTERASLSTDIFAELPKADAGVGSKDEQTAHKDYRNADGSINMGNILKIVNYSTIFGDEHKAGCDITKTSYDEYSHYDFNDLTKAESEADAVLTALKDMLYINTSTFSTYQDFDLVAEIKGVDISWESSDTSVIAISQTPTISVSSSEYYRAVVYRDSATDKQVTLTATATYQGKTITRTFNVNVKKDEPGIGELYIEAKLQGQDLMVLRNGDSFIVDANDQTFVPPILCVENAADYNGKLLKETDYNYETIIEYAKDKNSAYTQVSEFDISVAGSYKYTHKVSLATNANDKAEIIYYVLVAATTTSIDFLGYTDENLNEQKGAFVTVYQGGYIVSGKVSSPTGYIYSLSVEGATVPTAQEIIANGKSYEFRSDSVSYQFPSCTNNGKAYSVYYLLTDKDGNNTSKVYSTSISVVSINTPQKLIDTLKGKTQSNIIYSVVADLDFTGVKYDISSSKPAFKGLLNGNGHTIKNLTTNSAKDAANSLIYRLDGGTLMNFKFENINLNAGTGNKQVGLIAMSYGGYVYNISINNMTLDGADRVGCVIAQVFEGRTYIDQVSITNTSIQAGQRVGGIVGFIQSQSAGSTKYNYLECYISNCYVDITVVSRDDYAGGIVGRYDDRTTVDNNILDISYCVVLGTVKTQDQYCGGIVGAQSGLFTVKVYGCVAMCDLYHKAATEDTPKLTMAEKNCSGIFGRYNANATTTVERCYAMFDEHNILYDVISDSTSGWVSGAATTEYFWFKFIGFDSTRWSVLAGENGKTLVKPFVSLNFLDA